MIVSKPVQFFIVLILSLVHFGYIGKVFNFEIVIVFLSFLSLYYIHISMYNEVGFKFRLNLVWIWLIIIFVFWFFNALSIVIFGFEPGRVDSVFSSNNNILALVLIAILILILKPSEDVFWYLMWLGGIYVLFLFSYEILTLGIDAFVEGRRLGGDSSHPSKFGYYSVTFLIIILGSFYWAYLKSKLHLIVSALIASSLLMALIFSQTRTAWLGLPEALIVWLFYYYLVLVKVGKLSPKIFISFLILLFITVVYSYQYTSIGQIVEKRAYSAWTEYKKYVNRESFKSSVGYRLLGYEASLLILKKHWFMGVGEKDFVNVQREFTSKVAKEKFNINFKGTTFIHIHNQFIMTWLTRGVLPFLTLVCLFIFLIFYFYRRAKSANSFSSMSIPVAGLTYTVASFFAFMPEVFLQRGDTTMHFFFNATLLVVFSHLVIKEPEK